MITDERKYVLATEFLRAIPDGDKSSLSGKDAFEYIGTTFQRAQNERPPMDEEVALHIIEEFVIIMYKIPQVLGVTVDEFLEFINELIPSLSRSTFERAVEKFKMENHQLMGR